MWGRAYCVMSCMCVCVLHLSCVYIATLSYHHSIFVVFTYQSPSHSFHLPWFISFILLIIAHLLHIYHIWSSSCYIVIQPYFQNRLRNTILLKYIHLWPESKTQASKLDFSSITLCQKMSAVLTLEASIIILNHQTSLSRNQQ